MNEMEYLSFKERLRGIIGKIIVGLIIGGAIGACMNASSHGKIGIGIVICMAILCAGFPYAWSRLPIRLDGLVGIFITFCVAVAFGWVITPIAFLYNFIQMKRYEKKLVDNM